MRALLLEEWPTLSYLFHINPWDADRLSTAELVEYRRQGTELMQLLLKG